MSDFQLRLGGGVFLSADRPNTSTDADTSAEQQVIALYDALRPSMHGYVHHLVGSSREAEDLLHSAFVRLFEELRARRSIQSPRAWLYRVVHNLAMDAGRRRALERAAQDNLRLVTPTITPAAASVEDQFIRRESVERALAGVNERERVCLLLRADGLTYQEIGDVLGISAKAVSVYLARGLKKFARRHGRT